MAVMNGGTEFGFVPSETVSALHDLGNWKVRAEAIERLGACVSGLAPGGRAALPRIDEFVAFLKENIKESGWINFEMKESQDGRYYFELDTWEPKPQVEEDAPF